MSKPNLKLALSLDYNEMMPECCFYGSVGVVCMESLTTRNDALKKGAPAAITYWVDLLNSREKEHELVALWATWLERVSGISVSKRELLCHVDPKDLRIEYASWDDE